MSENAKETVLLAVDELARTFAGKSGDEVKAVRGVTFRVERGEFFTLLGPSGCGKTTTLRCVAGLEQPNGGSIRVAEKTVYSAAERRVVPPNKRDIGMVFQSYAIWPHMSVYDNVAFPLRVQRKEKSKDSMREQVSRSLATVGLGGYERRSATALSGGQQQRLALARALVWEPKLLLLDEPLSNLDAKLREELRVELKRLQRELGITSVYVTHDQVEALAMSDRVAVMDQGKIVQLGPPREIYLQPRSLFVARFVGNTNLVPGVVTGTCDPEETGEVRTAAGVLKGVAGERLEAGRHVLLSIRPEDVTLVPSSGRSAKASNRVNDGKNLIEGRAAATQFLGETADYRIDVDLPRLFNVRQSNRSLFHDGDEVLISAPVENCRIFVSDVGGENVEPFSDDTDQQAAPVGVAGA
jgi:iron(III) transport system ATP-binding protein